MLDKAAFVRGHLWAAVARWEPGEGKEKAVSPFTRGLDDNYFSYVACELQRNVFSSSHTIAVVAV